MEQEMNLRGSLVKFINFPNQLCKAEGWNLYYSYLDHFKEKPTIIDFVEISKILKSNVMFSSEMTARSFSKKVNGFLVKNGKSNFSIFFKKRFGKVKN